MEDIVNGVDSRGDKKFRFAKEFLKNSQNNGLSAVVAIGGCSEFGLSDIPDGFIKLAIIKVADTQDCFRHIADTYDCVLLNIGAAKNHPGNNVFIRVPREYEGLVIGLKGRNIKSSSEKLGKNIFIIPQSAKPKKIILKKRPTSYV